MVGMVGNPSVRPPLEGRLRRLQRLVIAWYASEGRALPWRGGADPYRVLVSEIMLQQTPVARVRPVFEAFCRRFPTVEDLAAAPLDEVLKAWRGLGYNRRAVALHRAARAIVEHHGGRVPDSLDALLALPGVGGYTARAVLAFAHGDACGAPVDTNVARVLARAAAGSPRSRSELQDLADRLVPAGDAAAWSHALMDLGAAYCTPRRPRCDACPVAAACAWRLRGGDADPAARPHRTQPAFTGSNRYFRGRLVDALRAGPLPRAEVAVAAGVTEPRASALADGLVGDGLAEWEDDTLRLPH